MPADREFALPAAGGRRRDLARDLGVAGFWRWWLRMLTSLVPAGPRAALQRRRTRPVVAFDGDHAAIWQAQGSEGRLGFVEIARVALGSDAALTASDGRNALAQLGKRASPVKVVVALPPRAILRKSLVLPAAVEPELRQALAYDLDRHTPFKPDELYFDAQVVGRDPVRGQVRVELATARRTQVDAAVAHAQAWGAKVVAVTPSSPPAFASSDLNLLPPEMRNGARFAKRWQFWLPIAALGLVALVAVVLPVWQKREYVIALNLVAGEAMQNAAVSESLRTQLERQVGDYNFALERKYAFPGTVRVLEDVTRILPDDTWLTQLEIKTSARGKDAQRDVTLRGESANAGRLVTLLEDSTLFTQAAPRSPTTKIQPGPGEIFDVGAQLKPLPAPASIALLSADATSPAPLPASGSAPADASASASAPSSSTPPPATAVAPMPAGAAASPIPPAAAGSAGPAAPPATSANPAPPSTAPSPTPAPGVVPAPAPPADSKAAPRADRGASSRAAAEASS
jgi:general secretion pathway protein L